MRAVQRIELPAAWTVRAIANAPPAIAARRFRAEVPGSIHLDLLRAGAIDDPYLGDGESKVQWVDRCEWEYAVDFAIDGSVFDRERVDLVFERIDTFATVALGDRVLGETANMFHPHRFDVRGALARSNSLRVRFRSAVEEVRREEARLGTLPWLNTPDPFNFARKSAYHFGWDWAPTLAGCGLGRVWLEAWDGARIVSVRPLVREASSRRAEIDVHVDLEGGAECVVELGGVRASGRASIPISIDGPALWWPRGYGAQPLYDLVVSAGGDRLATRTGIRAIALDTEGGAFTLRVNDVPVFCKGANFVPEDCFYTRATESARYAARLAQACDANMNTLRVWGGGFYESDEFYDRCDALGLLVWQDFLFACACYPEEEPHRTRVEAEARHQVARLARHPSLVLYNGCNENLWGYFDWNWQKPTEGRTWGRGYYFDLLPRVCAEVDPSRPYWPGSPHSGAFDPPNPPHPNASPLGNRHVWEAWDGIDHPVIGNEAPRFVSEFGFQGPPSFALLERAMTAPGSPLLQHQKSERGEAHSQALVRAFFGEPGSVDREHHLRQVVQARAVGSLIEWFRVLYPKNAGALFWQLNDAWPSMSWSAIDHDGRKKPLWYAVRRAFADRLLTFQASEPGSSERSLFFVNDASDAFEGAVAIERIDFDGRRLATIERDLRIAPRSVARVAAITGEIAPREPMSELLVARTGDLRAHLFFGADKDLALPRAEIAIAIDRDRVRIEARSLVRDAIFHVDRLDPAAELGDQLLTLPPGQIVELTLTSRRPIDPQALGAFPIFQSSR
jgi:beta-mannosidase